jgi:DNA-directed RNA polymerase specialized sigma24 family protein
MANPALGLTDLAVVRDIKSDGEGSTIRFSDGAERRLPSGNKEYAYWLQLLEESRDQGCPVSLSPDDVGAIDQVHQADNDFVEEIIVEPEKEARVFFQGHDGIFSLSPDLLDYSRVLNVLRDSARRHFRVWFVADGSLAIRDVILATNLIGEREALQSVKPAKETHSVPSPTSDSATDPLPILEDILRLFLANLPDGMDRHILDLKFGKNLSTDQIAAELGLKADALYQRLKRIRKQLAPLGTGHFDDI